MDTYLLFLTAFTPLGCVALGVWLGWWVRGLEAENTALEGRVAALEASRESERERAAGMLCAAAERSRAARAGVSIPGVGVLLDSITERYPSAPGSTTSARPGKVG